MVSPARRDATVEYACPVSEEARASVKTASMAAQPGEAARRVGMEEFAGCPGSPGDTDATGTDWSDWAESVTWHEAVASAHIARRRAAGAKRVTSSPFSLGMRPM